MEVGSSGGPDKNWVYGLSNTKAENLRAARNVSTIESYLSVSSTQSEEFMALKQQYAQLLADYQHLHQMIMDIVACVRRRGENIHPQNQVMYLMRKI
jgi:murein L,D-transpeptidase YcbB/YkuD